jgi:hypothetical protein
MADSHALFGSEPTITAEVAFKPRTRKMFTQRRRGRRDTNHYTNVAPHLMQASPRT